MNAIDAFLSCAGVLLPDAPCSSTRRDCVHAGRWEALLCTGGKSIGLPIGCRLDAAPQKAAVCVACCPPVSLLACTAAALQRALQHVSIHCSVHCNVHCSMYWRASVGIDILLHCYSASMQVKRFRVSASPKCFLTEGVSVESGMQLCLSGSAGEVAAAPD